MVNRGVQTLAPAGNLYPADGGSPPPELENHGAPSSSDGSEEEVDSDGSLFRSDQSPLRPMDVDGCGLHRVLWMPLGDMERLGTLAYVTLSDDAPTSTPVPYIRAVLMEATERVHYRMHPSSRGHMLLCFDSGAD